MKTKFAGPGVAKVIAEKPGSGEIPDYIIMKADNPDAVAGNIVWREIAVGDLITKDAKLLPPQTVGSWFGKLAADKKKKYSDRNYIITVCGYKDRVKERLGVIYH